MLRALALSPKQGRVVQHLFDGKRDKQIAAAMGLSVWTVRSHLTKIFSRADVADRAELVLKVFRLVREGFPAPSQRLATQSIASRSEHHPASR